MEPAPWDPRTTYRVRQLPSYIEDRSQAIALLIRLESSLGPTDNVYMYALACSANVWEKQPTKMTTVVFKRQPEILKKGKGEWVIRARDAGFTDNIILDTHFLDFTVFNDITPQLHKLDSIAISGLSSHAFGSWRSRGDDPNFMWLRDKLPRDISSLRSMIYGYDTGILMSSSTQTVDDIARLFITKLRSIGRSSLSARPLIVLAHSLGGIILKRALVMLANSGDTERYILESIKAIILFGVPSRGMQISHLLPMVEGQPNETLIKLLEPGSRYLSDLEEQFDGISQLQHIRLISVYETGLTKTRKKSQNGEWTLNGPEDLLVQRESAIVRGSREPDQLPIDQDHSNMVKFGEDDLNYRSVLHFLHDITQQLTPSTSSQVPSKVAGHGDSKVPSRLKSPFLRFTKRFKGVQTKNPEIQQATAMQNTSKASLAMGSRTSASIFPRKNAEPSNLDIAKEEYRQEMMDSLYLKEMDYRLFEIGDAYKDTFDWVFENEDVTIIEWLKYGSGLFWISGKPGSGKSTLMRHIWQNKRTKEALEETSFTGKQVSASFFFHNRGTHVQKSFEGLFRSTIHQILSQMPELKAVAWPDISTRQESTKSWSVQELERLFDNILKQALYPIRIILFFDALDEYDGPPEVIADFIKLAAERRQASATRTQICISSRPWNYFNDQFKTSPGFRIHEHTKTDVRKYATGRLDASPATSRMDSLNTTVPSLSSRSLIENIVDRAEGVFLWVRLTLDELVRAATNGANREELIEVVQKLPDKLDEFYALTIQRISNLSSTRMESFVMFEIVLRASHSMFLADFSAALACATCETLNQSQKRIPPEPYDLALHEQTSRRLKDRCGGLIEVSGGRVQFMHQTVKDFVLKPGFQQDILGAASSHSFENGYTFLSKYALTLLSFQRRFYFGDVRISDEELERENQPVLTNYLLSDVFYYSYQSEMTTGRSQQQYLDSIEPEVMDTAFAGVFWADVNYPRNFVIEKRERTIYSSLAFAVVSNLQLYVRETLSAAQTTDQPLNKPLLHCVVEASRGFNGEFDDYEVFIDQGWLNEMATLLLQFNADTEARYDGWTPLQRLFSGSTNDHLSIEVFDSIVTKLAEFFLSLGQDPNISASVASTIDNGEMLACNALHISGPKATEVLLSYGAEVNARDQFDRTPLDLAYLRMGFETFSPQRVVKILEHLLKSGGCVTEFVFEVMKDGKTALESALEELERQGYEIIPSMRSPPRLIVPQGWSVKRVTSAFRDLWKK